MQMVNGVYGLYVGEDKDDPTRTVLLTKVDDQVSLSYIDLRNLIGTLREQASRVEWEMATHAQVRLLRSSMAHLADVGDMSTTLCKRAVGEYWHKDPIFNAHDETHVCKRCMRAYDGKSRATND